MNWIIGYIGCVFGGNRCVLEGVLFIVYREINMFLKKFVFVGVFVGFMGLIVLVVDCGFFG